MESRNDGKPHLVRNNPLKRSAEHRSARWLREQRAEQMPALQSPRPPQPKKMSAANPFRLAALNLLKPPARRVVALAKMGGKKLLRSGSGFRLAFLFLHQRRALAETLAEVSQLRAANRTLAFHFNLVHTRRMHRENALHALAVADAAHGERLVQPAPALADHHARENLDAFLVAFHDLRVHANTIAHVEFRLVFAKLFRLNFFK